MTEEADGIDDAIEGQLRLLLTTAGQIGERLGRLREENARRAEAASLQETSELRTRIEAEKRVALADLDRVHHADWWDRAEPHHVANAYETARAWSDEAPEAVRAEHRIREEVRSRYGIDVANTGADPAAVQAALTRAVTDRSNASVERNRAAQEAADAHQLTQEANRSDRYAQDHRGSAPRAGENVSSGQDRGPEDQQTSDERTEAEREQAHANETHAAAAPMYDSAERREATAADLEARGIDGDLAATRMRSDVSQARPATAATRGAGKKAPKARKATGKGAQIRRTGLGR